MAKHGQQLYPQLQMDELRASDVVGDTYAVRILLGLENGPRRFSEIDLPGSSKTRSAKLKLLERHGLVSRTFHAEVPPRVQYALTTKGEELLAIVNGIIQWERSWQQR